MKRLVQCLCIHQTCLNELLECKQNLQMIKTTVFIFSFLFSLNKITFYTNKQNESASLLQKFEVNLKEKLIIAQSVSELMSAVR